MQKSVKMWNVEPAKAQKIKIWHITYIYNRIQKKLETPIKESEIDRINLKIISEHKQIIIKFSYIMMM